MRVVVGILLPLLLILPILGIILACLRHLLHPKDARTWQREIENSKGFEKIRNLIRRDCSFFEKDQMMYISLAVPYSVFVDTFYSRLNFEFSNDDYSLRFAEKIQSNNDKKMILSARVYGLLLSMFLDKSAIKLGAKVRLKKVKDYIYNKDFEECHKRIVWLTVSKYFKARNIENLPIDDYMLQGGIHEGGTFDNYFGVLSYRLIGKKLENDDAADPLIYGAFLGAIVRAYNQIDLKYAVDFRDEGLLR